MEMDKTECRPTIPVPPPLPNFAKKRPGSPSSSVLRGRVKKEKKLDEQPVADANTSVNDASLLEPAPAPMARPRAEPPMFNYERFEREFLPSDKKLKRIWPDDPVKATRFRDLHTEHHLTFLYTDWVHEVRALNHDERGRKYYNGLILALYKDDSDIDIERSEFFKHLEPFTIWEIVNLDNDGSTDDLQWRLNAGQNVFGSWLGTQLVAKYEHLVKEMNRPPKDDLETWEYYHMPENSNAAVSIIQRATSAHIFTGNYFGGEQAARKYGHLNVPLRNVKSYQNGGWFKKS